MGKTAILGFIVSVALLGSARAAEQHPADLTGPSQGYTYFNRAQATMVEHDADVRFCAASAASHGIMFKGGYENGLIPDLISGAHEDTRLAGNIENCMVAKGWSVVRLETDEGAALYRLDRQALAAKISEWVGAQNPHGEVVRLFANEAARGSTIKLSMPAFFAGKSISIRSVDLSDLSTPPLVVDQTEKGMYAIPLKEGDLGSIPSDKVIVIVRVVGNGQHNGEGIMFERMGPKPEVSAWEADHQTYRFGGAVPWTLFKGSAQSHREKMFAYALPPGRWRADSMSFTLDFCFGSPSFEAKAGEVIFLGTFDIAGEQLGPDMSLEPARSYLASAPALASAIKPAEWVNGSVGTCHTVYSYALEFPGYPFEANSQSPISALH